MNKQFITYTYYLLITLAVAGCSSCTPQPTNNLASISSAPLLNEEWKKHEFKRVGFYTKAPENILLAGERVYDIPTASFQLCPIHPPKKIFAEMRCRLIFKVRKINKKVLTDSKNMFLDSDSYKKSDKSNKNFWLWTYQIHEKTDSFTDGGYTYYRRDIGLGNDEILSADVEVLHAYGQTDKDREDDDILVKRILDSIKPL